MNSVSSQLAGVIENLRSQMNQLDAGARARNSRRLRLLHSPTQLARLVLVLVLV